MSGIRKYSLSLFLTLLLIYVVIAVPATAYAQSCGCEVSDRKERAYDEMLKFDANEKAAVETLHLPFGIPQSPANATNEHLLHQDEYIIMYDDDLRVPLWVGYKLQSSDLIVDRERTECFRRDIRLTDEAAAFCTDYEEPIYQRGHMVPNEDMVRSEVAMVNTFMFSNMCPQHGGFNNGIWKGLENRVRKWAKKKGQIYVITGAVFDKNEDEQRDADSDADRMKSNNGKKRVAVPTHFYKIILHEKSNGVIESLAFLLQHVEDPPPTSDEILASMLKSIDDIEKLTGIDFLVGLRSMENGAEKEEAIEAFKATSLWPTD